MVTSFNGNGCFLNVDKSSLSVPKRHRRLFCVLYAPPGPLLASKIYLELLHIPRKDRVLPQSIFHLLPAEILDATSIHGLVVSRQLVAQTRVFVPEMIDSRHRQQEQIVGQALQRRVFIALHKGLETQMRADNFLNTIESQTLHPAQQNTDMFDIRDVNSSMTLQPSATDQHHVGKVERCCRVRGGDRGRSRRVTTHRLARCR